MRRTLRVVMLAGAVALGACVPVETLPLTTPVVASSGGLFIEAPSVEIMPVGSAAKTNPKVWVEKWNASLKDGPPLSPGISTEFCRRYESM